jgi:hypothetical protein
MKPVADAAGRSSDRRVCHESCRFVWLGLQDAGDDGVLSRLPKKLPGTAISRA